MTVQGSAASFEVSHDLCVTISCGQEWPQTEVWEPTSIIRCFVTEQRVQLDFWHMPSDTPTLSLCVRMPSRSEAISLLSEQAASKVPPSALPVFQCFGDIVPASASGGGLPTSLSPGKNMLLLQSFDTCIRPARQT